ncbi:MAG: UDP-N-acetylmuramoyl-L-alanyl-D-glutamate--2,6-diaminopimelate ligase [Endomicrobium sp.]|nr:UDP-N-acetylmuramoyl-L-alanyl-D-glutamate--2,6-diaminopimelate ligase [Endomicrobium sp.]
MILEELLFDENVAVFGNKGVEVLGVSYDSRTIKKNFAFIAIHGHNTDGVKYIDEAIEKGASVIITDSKCSVDNITTHVVVEDVFRFMSIFSAKFYNYPDRELTIVGVTGTNGKTTITYMAESIFSNFDVDCGVVGTINCRYKGKVIELTNTTPQSLDIYRIMRHMVDDGVKYLLMEVSSHALELGRVYGIEFDIAVFTNLTREHLDFHKNIESYFEAKSILFKGLGVGKKKNKKYAIINADDKFGKKLLKMSIGAEVKTYSTLEKKSVDFKAENIELTSNGSEFDLFFGSILKRISINHIGIYNIYNALAAIAVAIYSGVIFAKVAEGLNESKQIPGRLERVDAKELGFKVFVDYAHTVNALTNVMQALKMVATKRIITVFGCGGDRDRTKRPLMGMKSVVMSDFVFLTSDNPRTENPNQIVLDIEVGIKKTNKNNYKVILDREIAVKEAITMAEKGDIVLIAGKGHEKYQVVGSKKVSFSDVKIAKKYLVSREKRKTISKKNCQKEFIF